MSIVCDKCEYQIDQKINELRKEIELDEGDHESMYELEVKIDTLKEIIDDTSDGPENHWFSKRYEHD